MKIREQAGFTLIEMIITIAIIAVIAAMAAPSFKKQITTMKIKDDLHKVEICFKESQIKAYTYRVPVTVLLNNGQPASLQCGDSAPIDLNSKVSLGAHVNSSTTFAPDRLVYSNYKNPGDSGNVLYDDTGLDANNAGFQFCISGYPQQILTVSSRGLVTIREGAICN